VLIAIPSWQGRVSPVFDVASRLLVVRLKGHAELERREVLLRENEPAGIALTLAELGAQVLICGAISQGLQLALQKAGIHVVAHICGEINAVVAAYRTGGLNHPEYLLPGCGERQLCASGRMAKRAPGRSRSVRQGIESSLVSPGLKNS